MLPFLLHFGNSTCLESPEPKTGTKTKHVFLAIDTYISLSQVLGTWLGSNTGRSRQGSFLLQKGVGAPEKACPTKDPPFIPNAGGGPAPLPWVRSGLTFFPVGSFETNCSREKRESGGGVVGRRFSRNHSKMESPRCPLMEKTCCFPHRWLPSSPFSSFFCFMMLTLLRD